MKDNIKKTPLKLFTFGLLIFSMLIIVASEELYASVIVDSILIKEVSQSYKKNSVTQFGLDSQRRAL